MEDVVAVAACRSAVGSFGGALKDVPPAELGSIVVRAVLDRGGVDASDVGHVVLGQVVNTEPKDLYLSRVVALNSGVPHSAVAMNVNRLCGSGLQAIISAAQSIMLGDTDVAIGGGVENMSRAPYLSPSQRWGARMGDAVLYDMMAGALNDPLERVHMGVTAEHVAKRYSVSREEQDALALASHQRAEHAIRSGYFRSQIVPVVQKSRKNEAIFDTDEHVRMGATSENFAALKPVFVKEEGTVTAGNASGINDGAGAVLLMSIGAAGARGIKPMARLVSYAHAGVEPLYMGIGPVPASRLALERAGIGVSEVDVIESNEAFAAQACAVIKEMGFDPAKVNPNGSGISLGHPIGATGAIITTKALHELERVQGRYALVTMCIGGGQGIAAVFERI